MLYYAPAVLMEQAMQMSPEDRLKGMEPWMAWMYGVGDALVDGGTPLEGGMNVSKSGSTPSNREVTGYSILQAEDMDSARALLVDHPHLDWGPGVEIEVHQMTPMGM